MPKLLEFATIPGAPNIVVVNQQDKNKRFESSKQEQPAVCTTGCQVALPTQFCYGLVRSIQGLWQTLNIEFVHLRSEQVRLILVGP